MEGDPLAKTDDSPDGDGLQAELSAGEREPEPIEAPTPVLALRLLRPRRDPNGGPRRSVAIAELAFDYASERVIAHAADGEDGSTVVHRNRGAEVAAEERLEALGLAPLASRGDLTAALVKPARPDQWVLARPGGAASYTRLLRALPRFETEGFRVEYHPSFPVEVLPAPDAWIGAVAEGSHPAVFELELALDLSGRRVALLPILRQALADPRFPILPRGNEPDDAVWLAALDARRRVPLPLARLRALIASLRIWLELNPSGTRLELPRALAAALAELTESGAAGLDLVGSEEIRGLGQRLRSAGMTNAEPPDGLKATLRPYQRDGLSWLNVLAECGLGGVLADDMGLGKTLQVLAHLLSEREAGRLTRPALVVVPTSLVLNWIEEARRFAPGLKLTVLHGSERDAEYAKLAKTDLVITTYALLPRDRDRLVAQPFALLVLDEAQAIKNPRAKAGAVAREIDAVRKIAVTGTPLENHLGELWSLLDVALPGLLGDERQFQRIYRLPIEKLADAEAGERLNRRIAPFILRRSKEQVASELPEKSLIVQKVELGGAQRGLYEALRAALAEKIRAAVAERGLAASGMVVLEALLRLRQACCDPRLLGPPGAVAHGESAKLEMLLPMLEELVAEGRKILLFSQFTSMLDLIGVALHERHLGYVRLDGTTRDRGAPIAKFQSGAVPIFLVSLKAGGVGLNLTAADTVIHYDPWWNPAVENQASDRAHRIGQTKPVFVYKLICAGTVEERIQELQKRKADLSTAVLTGGTTSAPKFDAADLEALFAPL